MFLLVRSVKVRPQPLTLSQKHYCSSARPAAQFGVFQASMREPRTPVLCEIAVALARQWALLCDWARSGPQALPNLTAKRCWGQVRRFETLSTQDCLQFGLVAILCGVRALALLPPRTPPACHAGQPAAPGSAARLIEASM